MAQDTFNVTISLPKAIELDYKKLKKQKRLALSQLVTESLRNQYPEIKEALEAKQV
ncbi:hypothetical protein SAMN05421780_104282 [Flexibacter flexilis DSM 6793]|uniref:Uncharacterized protein n=1 Tax=Flexibacter flexilis DSM 6793 TaxID=927664 RepID=A0A1I1IA57_9BACT|nr:hypothetical protein [Flexibacter flexilis]SFC33054.1 hypothetical protein SAMN05421780_104282 [Flexibacter flexilis DSM 6793]